MGMPTPSACAFHGRIAFKFFKLRRSQGAPLTCFQISQLERANARADQAHDRVPHRGAHVADLALFAFMQDDVQPGLIARRLAKGLMARAAGRAVGA